MNRWTLGLATLVVAGRFGFSQTPQHLNPMIDLLQAHKPVLGLYAPRNGGRGGRGGRGGAAPADAPPPPPPKTAAQLASEALAYKNGDFVFDGSMEDDFDRAFPIFADFMNGLADAGGIAEKSRLHHPVVVKTHLIAPDPQIAASRIGRQLNLGVSGIMFVGVESADEVKAGLAAMRFRSKGGTRPDDVGNAPAVWGITEAQYRDKADLWPLNPKGELVNWTIVESKEGLAHVREIAAVKGIGVLWPGAGTLGGVFSHVDPTTGRRVRDDVAWEAAIQQVLAACKEFKVPCGFPANTPEIMEMRAKQGFSVFVSNWGDAGFATVDAGHKLSEKP